MQYYRYSIHIFINVCVWIHTDTEVVDIKSVRVGDPAGTWESPLAPTHFEKEWWLYLRYSNNHTIMAFHPKRQMKRKKGVAFRWWLLFPYLPHNLLNVLICSGITIILNMPGHCYQWNTEQQWWKEQMWSVFLL